ncbi:IS3 family transposase [Bacillus sp. CCNWLW147]|uniref:IS3 family transposase n=1 Tax=unclassified Bacillus (in: firmicutes) TaxID=185979 RepID=UPI00304CC2D0
MDIYYLPINDFRGYLKHKFSFLLHRNLIMGVFRHMKDKLNYKDCEAFESLQLVIKDYMEDYNCYQWTLQKMAPVEYETIS